jgi:predicted acetyltransferase
MLDLARELGYPDVLVTCDVGNAASRRVIEKAGGRFVDEFDDAGESVLRYRFPL